MTAYAHRPKLYTLLALLLLLSAAGHARAADWYEWRGPARDGVSHERGLPSKWSPAGDNLAWKAPYGGRSTPVVMGGRVYLFNPADKGDRLQERLMCLDADTGKVVWERRFNVYLSDVPPHRIGWASPVGDPATGNVYAMGGGGHLVGLSGKDGKILWERSLGEDFGLLTTHGGRTVSPLVDGDLVITSGVTFSWGSQHRGLHRWMAFDKRTGETVWTSAPGARPYDTTYAAPIIANVNGTRLLIQGASDGWVHAIKPQTGEPVWKIEVSKRGLNTGVVVRGTDAIITHSEENLDSNEMGMMAALDASLKGELKMAQLKWKTYGWQGGFSSPVLDGDRLYQVDNGANLGAFDVNSGKQLWLQNLGTIQKASPVFADGKLYVGTENGKFFIIEPSATGAKILDEDQLGTEQQPEAILASVAVSDGRVFLLTDAALYCIGKKTARPVEKYSAGGGEPTNAQVAHVQVVPAEVLLKPGESARFRVRLFDERGNFVREEKAATWSLDKLNGKADAGQFTASSDAVVQTGEVRATVGGLVGAARVRVIPPLPWDENFDAMELNTFPQHWTNTGMKFITREVDGRRVFVKTTEGSSLLSRARAFMGPGDLHDYTVEADILATTKRRQVGDAGVIAQRYSLTLFGNAQKLELTPWQPETARRVDVPFEWKTDTWYRVKLRVENLPDGQVRARGKAWPSGSPEPEAWAIERTDPIGNHQGSPGIFGSALAEIYFDNVKVYANK
ncbi:MAG TPA: PQQ-binding-like beta-propeller repeat protein [Pyrinomonadaceae bacterium]|jgi:outer membrane protein assembly factor BamB|nr:PQQ-binding-like beta-propeller repeat protein [Pyrinomonadaceae bacterium]